MAHRRTGTVVAWLVIAASVVSIVAARYDGGGRSTPSAGASFPLRVSARYAVGVNALSAGFRPAATTAPAANAAAGMLPQLDQAAARETHPAARLVVAVVAGEVAGGDAALKRLERLDTPEAAALRAAYGAGPEALSPHQRDLLKSSLGWFGDLALVYGKPPDDPGRQAVLGPARRTALVMLGATLAAVLALLAGGALLVTGIVFRSLGRLRFAYDPPGPQGRTGPFLEAFAAYLGGMALLSAVVGFLATHRLAATWLTIGVVPLAVLWPLLRGVEWRELRHGLGWTTGRGLLREAAAGVVGYLAGLPVLAAGIVVTAVLQRLSGEDVSHPIAEELARGGAGRAALLVLLAAAWAPLVEETMFRGAFYHHLRSRLPWPLAAGVVGLLFAAIHPQGWAAIPALGAIGFSFAVIREWRGSIVGPVVAHALNNGALTVLLLFMLR